MQAYGQHMGNSGLGQEAFGYGGGAMNQGNMMDALQAQFAGLNTGARREAASASRQNGISASSPNADA